MRILSLGGGDNCKRQNARFQTIFCSQFLNLGSARKLAQFLYNPGWNRRKVIVCKPVTPGLPDKGAYPLRKVRGDTVFTWCALLFGSDNDRSGGMRLLSGNARYCLGRPSHECRDFQVLNRITVIFARERHGQRQVLPAVRLWKFRCLLSHRLPRPQRPNDNTASIYRFLSINGR